MSDQIDPAADPVAAAEAFWQQYVSTYPYYSLSASEIHSLYMSYIARRGFEQPNLSNLHGHPQPYL